MTSKQQNQSKGNHSRITDESVYDKSCFHKFLQNNVAFLSLLTVNCSLTAVRWAVQGVNAILALRCSTKSG